MEGDFKGIVFGSSMVIFLVFRWYRIYNYFEFWDRGSILNLWLILMLIFFCGIGGYRINRDGKRRWIGDYKKGNRL